LRILTVVYTQLLELAGVVHKYTYIMWFCTKEVAEQLDVLSGDWLPPKLVFQGTYLHDFLHPYL
jgi:hypothetical protein